MRWMGECHTSNDLTDFVNGYRFQQPLLDRCRGICGTTSFATLFRQYKITQPRVVEVRNEFPIARVKESHASHNFNIIRSIRSARDHGFSEKCMKLLFGNLIKLIADRVVFFVAALPYDVADAPNGAHI